MMEDRPPSQGAVSQSSPPQVRAQDCHCLEFDSCWNEGNRRRSVFLRYNISEGAFQIAIDEDSNLYHVPIVYAHKTGESVTVWDLFVGAELDILGRQTTLQHCSQMTAQWNAYWAGWLAPLRTRLSEELRKYETRKAEPWLSFQKKSSEAGSANLRLLINQVNDLQARLAEYRPRLADKLGVPIEMFEIEQMHRADPTGLSNSGPASPIGASGVR